MDYAFGFDHVKAEKANAMRRYNFFRTMTKLFRFTEIFVAMILLTWVFTRIPFAVEISGTYLRRISDMVGSPLFVFIVCNVIVATLIAKSGLFGGGASSAENAETELYLEILKSSGDRTKIQSQPAATEEVMFQDKEVVSERNGTPREKDMEKFPLYRRTQSEKVTMKQTDQKATEKHIERANSGADLKENIKSDPHDNLSSEEFQRTVDEFIAERMRFLRQESLAIVVQNQS